jgi:hypothetical protein
VRGLATLNGLMKTQYREGGPQVAFLKAEPRAARRRIPHTRDPILGHNKRTGKVGTSWPATYPRRPARYILSKVLKGRTDELADMAFRILPTRVGDAVFCFAARRDLLGGWGQPCRSGFSGGSRLPPSTSHDLKQHAFPAEEGAQRVCCGFISSNNSFLIAQAMLNSTPSSLIEPSPIGS